MTRERPICACAEDAR